MIDMIEELPNWLGIASLTEDERLKLNNPEAIPVIRIFDAKIVFDEGKIDDRLVKILYYSRIGNNTPKLSKYSIKDVIIYKTFIEMNKFYNNEKKWYDYVDDVIDIDVELLNDDRNMVNPEYIYKMYRTINRHSDILSAFSTPITNSLSFIWRYGKYNIFGFSFIIHCIGYARDYMNECYGKGVDVPISACEGRKGTKDCLYKIIQKVYPDFYYIQDPDWNMDLLKIGARYWDHYNHSNIEKDIVSNSELTELERINNVESRLASKYASWYKEDDKIHETKLSAGNRIRLSMQRSEENRSNID